MKNNIVTVNYWETGLVFAGRQLLRSGYIGDIQSGLEEIFGLTLTQNPGKY